MTEGTPPDFEALLLASLRDPEAEAELYRHFSRPLAVLVAGFSQSRHRVEAEGPAYAAALARAAERAFLTPLELAEPRVVRRLRDGLLVAFDAPTTALEAAMNGLMALDDLNKDRRGQLGDRSRQEPIHVGLGLGFGEALVDPAPDLLGAEVNAAFHLAGAAGAGEILGTDRFMAALGPLPSGVGAHRGRADRAHAIGMAFTVLRDYRA